MYSGPIIDTHIHFWDLAKGYAWLTRSYAQGLSPQRDFPTSRALFERGVAEMDTARP